MPQISAIIPKEIHKKIEEEADKAGKSKAQVMRERLDKGYKEGSKDLIEEKSKRIKSLENQIKEIKENRRKSIKDKEDKIDMLKTQIEEKQDQVKELQNLIQELQKDKKNTETFGEWITSTNTLARFFIKTGIMMSGWNVPKRVKENEKTT